MGATAKTLGPHVHRPLEKSSRESLQDVFRMETFLSRDLGVKWQLISFLTETETGAGDMNDVFRSFFHPDQMNLSGTFQLCWRSR